MGPHHFRYWDGWHWTEHVSTNGVQGVDSLSTMEWRAPPTVAAPKGARTWSERVTALPLWVRVAAPVTAAAILIAGVVAARGHTNSAADASATTTAMSSAPRTPDSTVARGQTSSAQAPAQPSNEDIRQRALSYKSCTQERDTLQDMAVRVLTSAKASVKGFEVVQRDRNVARVAADYIEAQRPQQALFDYTIATGRVAAVNTEASNILDALKAECASAGASPRP